jgi:hypothetical protein
VKIINKNKEYFKNLKYKGIPGPKKENAEELFIHLT